MREGNRLFVDPLWDPIRGYIGPSPDVVQLRRIAADASRVVELAENLLHYHDKR